MIDFSIEDETRSQIAKVREISEAGLKYSRYYDEHEEELAPNRLPEADDFRGRGVAGRGRRLTATDEALFIFERSSVDGIPLSQGRRDMGNHTLDAMGTPEQKERFSHLSFTFAMTEPGCGSDTSALRTTAELHGDEWVLNGEKIFASGGIRSDGAVVWATIDRDAGRAAIKPFLVLRDTPGFSVASKEKKLGIRAQDTAALIFSNCRVPRDQLLGGNEEVSRTGSGGYRGAMATFNKTRPRVSAVGIGHALGCLRFCKEELEKEGIEVEHGPGMHSRSAAQQMLIEIEADIEAASLSVLRATTLADSGQPNSLEAAICKSKAGEIARTVPQRCLEILGGSGLSREHLVEKWLRDARITDIYEGTGEIMRLIIARQILGYSSEELR
ncbi:MAG: acyl-CoA dehydrogenase [bacterium]|nr:acyl-CoA dehydrogenase [bacterium]